MITPHIHPLGVSIATVFTVAMSSLLWWMLHPPKAVSFVAAKVRVAVDQIKVILVPTIGTEYSERGIELACRLGQEQHATIQLVNIVEVPLSLPLGAILPEQEEAALNVLQQGKGIVETHNLTSVTRLERARHAAEKLVEIVQKENIELIVLGLFPKLGGVENVIGRTTETLLRRLPCEIIIDAKPPEDSI